MSLSSSFHLMSHHHSRRPRCCLTMKRKMRRRKKMTMRSSIRCLQKLLLQLQLHKMQQLLQQLMSLQKQLLRLRRSRSSSCRMNLKLQMQLHARNTCENDKSTQVWATGQWPMASTLGRSYLEHAAQSSCYSDHHGVHSALMTCHRQPYWIDIQLAGSQSHWLYTSHGHLSACSRIP